MTVLNRCDACCAVESKLPASAPGDDTSNRLRALHVINGEHYAGAERVQDLLAARLPDFGVDVAFACVKPDKFPALRRSQQTVLHQIPMRQRWDLRPAWKLARLLRAGKFDILHAHSARAAMIAAVASRLSGVPLVLHVHGNTATEIRGRAWTRLNAWAERQLLPRCAAVIAVSASVADYLRSAGAASNKVFVVPNGVPSRREMRPRLDYSSRADNRTSRLGFVALLRPRKGLEVVLDAAAILLRQGLDISLRIVGRFETAEYELEIAQQVARLQLADRIDWRGFQTDVDAELNQMDVLLFPSVLPEGLPMVVLEAMAAGVPIVATRVPGVTDVLRDGENGLLVEPNDASALASGISQLIENPALAERLRTAAWHDQQEHYSDKSMAEAVAGIYRQVLARSTVPFLARGVVQ
ncbi:MAG: glycosyltransferase family 4 protein [Planctomycetota bacterium]|nr:glycosyltransferase family 4 protein [Planctomycetota bacterium]